MTIITVLFIIFMSFDINYKFLAQTDNLDLDVFASVWFQQ